MGTALEAGSLRTTFDGGGLGAVTVQGHAVWHGVHFLLRDRHWRTPLAHWRAPELERLAGGGWRLSASGTVQGWPQVALEVCVEAAASDEATITFTGQARVLADIEVNRLGLCLLHPLAAAGRAVQVRHDDGRVSCSTFPELISPWPPFTAIRCLRHEVAAGWIGCAEFDGESFELEDQRNNADASYKTYSRSNFMPRPYGLQAGTVVRHSVRLGVAQGRIDVAAAGGADAAERAERGAARPRAAGAMRVGIEIQPEDLERVHERAAWLGGCHVDHLHLAHLVPADPLNATALAQLLHAAGATLRLDLLEIKPEQAHLTLPTIAAGLRAAGVVPSAVAVFPTTAAAVSAARRAFPGAHVGGGTADFFVQLNRAERLPPLDFLSFTVCPIVHQADDATVNDSHLSLNGMLRTLAVRHPGMPVHLGPSLIAARRSPLGELAAPAQGDERIALARSDARDATAFGAAWAAAHLAAAQAAGAAAATTSRLAHCAPGSPMARMLGARRRLP